MLIAVFFTGISIDFVATKLWGYPPITGFFLHEFPFTGQQFEEQAWFDASDCQGLSDSACAEKHALCERGPMVTNLLNQYLIAGETHMSDVVALLGPAEDLIDVNSQTACQSYNLGICSGLGFDYDSLYICFGDSDVVESAGHLQH